MRSRWSNLRGGPISLAALCAAALCGATGFAAAKPADLVLVAGASGRTGKLVVEQLVAKHYRVRALVRDKARAQAELPPAVELAVGDVRDPATLTPAMQGVRYVVSAIGASGSKPTPGNGFAEVDFQGNANLAAAAKQAKISQFVLITSGGTANPAANPMVFMRPILVLKAKGEAALRDSGVPYTIVRPGGLTDDVGGKHAVTFSAADGPTGRIARADVATVCVEALGRKSALGKSVAIISGQHAWPNNWDKDFRSITADH